VYPHHAIVRVRDPSMKEAIRIFGASLRGA
jgi:hypothetical protein